MKRQIALFLCLILCLNVLSAFAEGDFTYRNYTLTDYNGEGGDVYFPSEYEGKEVRNIGSGMFQGNNDITSAEFDDNISLLEDCVFNSARNLSSVTLPGSLVAIGTSCFAYTNLSEIVLPGCLSIIDENAFQYATQLKSITFTGGDVPVINKNAFEGISDDAVFYVPDDVLDDYAAILPKGYEVRPSGQRAVFSDWPPANEDFEFDAETGTFLKYTGTKRRITIPDELYDVPVVAIASKAFEFNEDIIYVTLPDTIETIGENAFAHTIYLKHVDLPSSLKTIENEAFYGLNVKSLELPEGLETIGDRAFSYCSVSGELYLPEGLRTIGEEAFNGSPFIKEIYFPTTIESIGSKAFAQSSINYLYFANPMLPTFGENIFRVDRHFDVDLPYDASSEAEFFAQTVFDQSGLDAKVWRAEYPGAVAPDHDYEYDLESGVLTRYDNCTDSVVTVHHSVYTDDTQTDTIPVYGIGPDVFKGNQSIRTFAAPHSGEFREIGSGAFADSSLVNIDFFETTGLIGEGAFRNSQLEEVTLPESLYEIGEGAFADCKQLKKVTINCDSYLINTSLFEGCGEIDFRVSDDATDEFIENVSEALERPWYDPVKRESDFFVSVSPMDYTAITPEEDFEFDAATGTLTGYNGANAELVIPRSINGTAVTRIGSTFGDNMRDYTGTEIEGGNDHWLKVRLIILPETVTEIEDGAFEYIQSLEEFYSFGPITMVGTSAFGGCTSLTRAHFVNGVYEINDWAFDGCTALDYIWLGNHVNWIGQAAFRNTGLRSVYVNAHYYADFIFKDCANLEEAVIGPAMRGYLGSKDFLNCPKLSVIRCEFDSSNAFKNTSVFSGIAPDAVLTIPATASLDLIDTIFANNGSEYNGFSDKSQIVYADAPYEPDTAQALPALDSALDAVDEAWLAYLNGEEPVVEEPEVEEPAGEPTFADLSLCGEWTLAYMEANGNRISAEAIGNSGLLKLNEDGTASLLNNGTETAMTWEGNSLEAGVMSMHISTNEDGELILSASTGNMVFVRAEASEEAAEEPVVEEPVVEEPVVEEPVVEEPVVEEPVVEEPVVEEPVVEEPIIEEEETEPDYTPYVGSWVLDHFDIGGKTYSAKEIGSSARLDIYEDGSITLDNDGTDEYLQLTLDEEKNASFETDEGALKSVDVYDDVLILSGDDGSMVFMLSEEDTDEPEEEEEADISRFVGSWVLDHFDIDGKIYSAEQTGSVGGIIIDKDGSLILSNDGEVEYLQLESANGYTTFEMENGVIRQIEYADGQLWLVGENGDMVFVRATANEEAPKPEPTKAPVQPTKTPDNSPTFIPDESNVLFNSVKEDFYGKYQLDRAVIDGKQISAKEYSNAGATTLKIEEDSLAFYDNGNKTKGLDYKTKSGALIFVVNGQTAVVHRHNDKTLSVTFGEDKVLWFKK